MVLALTDRRAWIRSWAIRARVHRRSGLGQRDLSVLVQHFQDNPGQLILQQGGTESLLYQSRAQTVYENLLAGGIPDGKIQIADGMPGGDGIASNSIIEILETEKTEDMSQGIDMDFGSGSN